jgi:hypothetical protein
MNTDRHPPYATEMRFETAPFLSTEAAQLEQLFPLNSMAASFTSTVEGRDGFVP